MADVDAGGTDLDATAAVDAVAGDDARRGLAAGFAAFLIITHDDGVVVDEGGLEPAVGTDDQAELLAEPPEVEEEHPGGHGHRDERRRMGLRGGGDHRVEPGDRDEVGQEDVRDRPAEHQIGQRAAAAAEELGRPAPRLGV